MTPAEQMPTSALVHALLLAATVPVVVGCLVVAVLLLAGRRA